MTRNILKRAGLAIVMAGLLAGGITPAFAEEGYETNLDGNANETLNALANMVDANDLESALALTNYLRYNCIRAIDVNGHRLFLVEIEKYIAQPNPDVIVAVANRAEEVGPATFVRMSMFDCPANEGHNNSTSSSPEPSQPPTTTTTTAQPPS